MGLTRKVKRNLDNSSGLPPELQDSINSLFDDFYGKEDDDDEEMDDIQWKSNKDKESGASVETDNNQE